jgi:hypothetical protein
MFAASGLATFPTMNTDKVTTRRSKTTTTTTNPIQIEIQITKQNI